MKKVKNSFGEFMRRSVTHWKTSLIGAIEGSGILTAGILSGSREVKKAAIIVSVYLFIKGLFSKDGAK